MFTLLAMLTPIALIDSTSVVPLAIIPLLVLMSGKKALLGSFAFLASIFVTYLLCGVLLVIGINSVFDSIHDTARRIWTEPNTLEIWLQIVIGTVLTLLGFRLAVPKAAKERVERVRVMSPWQATFFGIGFTLAGLWGAFPYFAAIDQILQEDLAMLPNVLVLLYYNLIYILPLILLVVARMIWQEKSDPLFHSTAALLKKWGHRIVVVILILLGVALIADGIGLFFGYPILPT